MNVFKTTNLVAVAWLVARARSQEEPASLLDLPRPALAMVLQRRTTKMFAKTTSIILGVVALVITSQAQAAIIADAQLPAVGQLANGGTTIVGNFRSEPFPGTSENDLVVSLLQMKHIDFPNAHSTPQFHSFALQDSNAQFFVNSGNVRSVRFVDMDGNDLAFDDYTDAAAPNTFFQPSQLSMFASDAFEVHAVVFESAFTAGLPPDPSGLSVFTANVFVSPDATVGEWVPEPSTLALAVIGLLSLGFVAWRRRPAAGTYAKRRSVDRQRELARHVGTRPVHDAQVATSRVGDLHAGQ